MLIDEKKSGIVYCKRCVMNNETDSSISFDEHGYCDYCDKAIKEMNKIYFPNQFGREKLERVLAEVKQYNKNKPYDCVMGLSGGIDSSYLAFCGYKWGLRILAVHIDDGYDTEITKNNLKRLCKATNIELRTIIPNENQYNDLLLSYLKAGVSGICNPQDNILFAFLYDTVRRENLKYFFSGGNFSTECILQRKNIFNAMDVKNIKAIHKKFGTQSLDQLKFISPYKKMLRIILGKVVTFRPLNFIDYNYKKALTELKDFCGFEYYGGKHLENWLTAFNQLYWSPKKFNLDINYSHLSSMIVSKQITREEALSQLMKPYDETAISYCVQYIKRKLNLSDKEFNNIMKKTTSLHTDYAYDWLDPIVRKILSYATRQ